MSSSSEPLLLASGPTYKFGANRDPTDLYAKALLYVFKRLQINRLASFPSEGTLRYSNGQPWNPTSDDTHLAKLDIIYNVARFEKVLTADEYRVLIDYPKNKFRMMCVLSERPSASLLRPSSPSKGHTTTPENGLPVLFDYKERAVPAFEFSLLKVENPITCRELADFLAESLFYVEHHSYVPLAARLHTARAAVCATFPKSSQTSVVELLEDTKAQLLLRYLRSLAVIVQVVRIYDLHSKKNQMLPTRVVKTLGVTNPSTPPRLRTAQSFSGLATLSPQANLTLSPQTNLRALSPKKSNAHLQPGITKRPSVAEFRANEAFNPVTAPSPERKLNARILTLDANSLLTSLFDFQVQPELWSKCQQSIQDKLARERRIIKG